MTTEEADRLFPELDAQPGPAKRISSARAKELIAAALAAEGAPASRREATPRRRIAMLVAVSLIATSAASAAIYTWVRDVPVVAKPPQRAAVAALLPPARPDVDAAPAVYDELIAAEAEVVDAGARRARERLAPAPKDLLRLANEQRKHKRWSEADQLYLRIIRSHPTSDEAYVARVSSAQLALDHLNAAARALRLYRAALTAQPRGALAEEARYGVVESYRALSDQQGEARALTDFLERHPSSPLAAQARARQQSISR